MQISKLSSEYYSLVPIENYAFERIPPISNHEMLKEKLGILHDLLDLQCAGTILLGAQAKLTSKLALIIYCNISAATRGDVENNVDRKFLVNWIVHILIFSLLSLGINISFNFSFCRYILNHVFNRPPSQWLRNFDFYYLRMALGVKWHCRSIKLCHTSIFGWMCSPIAIGGIISWMRRVKSYRLSVPSVNHYATKCSSDCHRVILWI